MCIYIYIYVIHICIYAYIYIYYMYIYTSYVYIYIHHIYIYIYIIYYIVLIWLLWLLLLLWLIAMQAMTQDGILLQHLLNFQHSLVLPMLKQMMHLNLSRSVQARLVLQLFTFAAKVLCWYSRAYHRYQRFPSRSPSTSGSGHWTLWWRPCGKSSAVATLHPSRWTNACLNQQSQDQSDQRADGTKISLSFCMFLPFNCKQCGLRT